MTNPRRRAAFLLLTACAGIVIGLSAMAIGVTVEYLRKDAIRAAERESSNAALAVAEQLMRTVRPVDGVLTELRDVVPALGIATPKEFSTFFGSDEQRQFLEERLRRERAASALGIFDSNGRLVQASPDAMRRDLASGLEEHLRRTDRMATPGLQVSPPIASPAAGQPMIYLTRRIRGATGSHVGLAAAAVPADYFDHLYGTIEMLPGQSFLISRQDGTLLANRPSVTGVSGPVMPRTGQWYEVAARGGGTYRVVSGNDPDDTLIVSVQTIPETPFVVSSGILESAALAEWRRHAVRIGIGSLLAFVCAIALLWALKHQFDRLVTSQESLSERETRLAEKSRELERMHARLDAAVNNMAHGLCMYDRDDRLVVCNAAYRSMYGLSEDDTRAGTTIRKLVERRRAVGTFQGDYAARIAEVRQAVDRGRPSRFVSELSNGRVIAMTVSTLRDGGWVSVHEDITERTRAEKRIAHLARHDPLTDLANRLLFRERMDEVIARLETNGDSFAVMIFDIDLFKSVNDSLGHSGGDALLEAVAERLRRSAAPTDTLGRIGGDEFAVIQTARPDPRAAATALAETLLQELRAPYDIEGKRIVIGISIGIAVAPDDGREPSQILKSADLALYRAKADGRGCFRFFEPAMDADVRLQREFEFELREALVRQEFEIHYQPIVDIATARPCAVEALVRWRHPHHGLIPPDKFIPVAEEIGLIIPLGEWILGAACRTAVAWPDDIRLAVNLSAVQFRSGTLVDVVRSALRSSGLPATRLELEITESVLLQKDQDSIAVLHELAGLGVRIVLDDFGTGYSSLSYLQLFPFSKIKIDKSFVAEMSSRSDCAAIVSTIINLAKALDMGTTAEGVETQEQAELLRAAGCREAQGWLFGRPGPPSALVLDRPAEPAQATQTPVRINRIVAAAR